MEFVALIVRNKIYTSLKDKMLKDDKKSNQKEILKAFGIKDITVIKKMAKNISEEL